MLNYTTADLVVSCQQGDDLLSSSSLQQLLEESRQVISSSRPHSSVVNSSGTTDPLYAHKCQTPQQHQQQQQPTTPTYKVEFHSSHLSSSVSTCFHGVWWRHRCELFSCSSLGVLWWNSFFFFCPPTGQWNSTQSLPATPARHVDGLTLAEAQIIFLFF